MGIFIGTIILLGALVLFFFHTKNQYKDRVYPGVSIFSTSISGMTREELSTFLTGEEKKINQKKIVFDKKWEITPQTIDFSIDKDTTITNAFLPSADLFHFLTFSETIDPVFQHSSTKLDDFIKQIALAVNTPVKEALFEFKEGKVAIFQPSQEGFGVNEKELKSIIISYFTKFENLDLIETSLPTETLQPKVETNASNDLGIETLLGEGESFFFDSIPNRVHNIALASGLMHGIVIPPGETFSFAEKIGDISAKTGYQQAYVIKEGKTVLDDGGGVCQVSTTLFRAALNTGLPIVERQAHAYRVGFYEQGAYPPGLDATVYPPSPDLKFKNDTPAYILIQTEIDQAKKRLVFKFYGTNDGRKTEMTKPVILSQTPPPDPIYVDDPTLPVGTEKKFDSAHWGAKVSFTRKVLFSNGELKEEKTFNSNYTPWPAVYFRGTKI